MKKYKISFEFNPTDIIKANSGGEACNKALEIIKKRYKNNKNWAEKFIEEALIGYREIK
jgi:hypothetical protein